MSKLWTVLCALIGILNALSGQAKLVQILHTNDLHSYLESTIKDPNKGGYATLKGLIDKERQRALRKGIPTLVLDAGDFLEGNLFFLSDGGKQVMKVMNQIKAHKDGVVSQILCQNGDPVEYDQVLVIIE